MKLATYDDYLRARAAIDRLSDDGFPISTVSIQWRGLHRVDHVTGRRRFVTAAGEGAAVGAWLGALIGALRAVLVEPSIDLPAIGVTGMYVVVGAVGGALWRAAGHWLRNGTGHLSTRSRLDADSYELWVEAPLLGLASDLLGPTPHPELGLAAWELEPPPAAAHRRAEPAG
jgi:hypothetical protein